MEQAQPNSSLTLEEVHDHFQLWRDTRQSQRERIPDDLIAEAASLLGRYPQADILRELGLNRKRLLSASPPPHTPAITNSEDATGLSPFVQLPWPTPATTSQSLELTHPNGMTLRLQDCNEALLSQMINTFMDHSPCCK